MIFLNYTARLSSRSKKYAVEDTTRERCSRIQLNGVRVLLTRDVQVASLHLINTCPSAIPRTPGESLARAIDRCLRLKY